MQVPSWLLSIGRSRGVNQSPVVRTRASSAVEPTHSADPSEQVEFSPAPPAPAPSRLSPQHWLPALGEALQKAVPVSSPLAGLALALGRNQEMGPDLKSLPTARLERPLVLVPGFQTREDAFDALVEKLTENGANGGRVYYVDAFGVYLDKRCTQKATLTKDCKVFVAAFDSNQNAPPVGASILGRALDQITKVSGDSVDTIGYSMGGLAARLYLDQGGTKIGKFMMVGTPNHGSPLAAMGMGLLDKEIQGKKVGWLLNGGPKSLSQKDRSALTWLMPADKPGNNVVLEDLNSRWHVQRQAVEDVAVVGSQNMTTLRFDFKPGRGDGTVPVESLAPTSDTPVVLLEDRGFRRHGKLLQSGALYQEMTRFFGWQVSS